MGNGAAQRQAAAQREAAANAQSAAQAQGQNATVIPGLNAPAPAGAIMLDAIPLGSIFGTGGGHYNPLPVITNGGGRTFLASTTAPRAGRTCTTTRM